MKYYNIYPEKKLKIIRASPLFADRDPEIDRIENNW